MYRDLALTSLDTIRGYDITTGVHLFTLDELSNATIAQTQEKQDIVGKLGRKLSSFKKNKAVTVSATNGLVSGGLFELQTGSKFKTPDGGVAVRVTEEIVAEPSTYESADTFAAGTTYYTSSNGAYTVATGVTSDSFGSGTYFTVATTKVKIKNDAAGTVGHEIDAVDVIDENGTVKEHLDQTAGTITAGKFTYTPSTDILEFDVSDVPVGYTVGVHYDTMIDADVLKNKSDKYSKNCNLYIDATAEDICGNTYHVQFHLPKADVNGEFSLEMGDNQTVHAFEAEALSGACGVGAVFFEYIVFGTQADDEDDDD